MKTKKLKLLIRGRKILTGALFVLKRMNVIGWTMCPSPYTHTHTHTERERESKELVNPAERDW